MPDEADDVTRDVRDHLAEARRLLNDCEWEQALDATRHVDAKSGSNEEADRLDIVAEASWWIGRLDDCIDAREAAYAAYDAIGDHRRAGQCAVWLWEHHAVKARPAIGGGWLRRARRALEDHPETVEFASLVLREAEVAHGAGTLDEAQRLAGDALALCRRLRSQDMEAQALQTLGRILIDSGRPQEGLAHLDEAMLSALEGKLSPYTTGKVYCSLISACKELGDPRRAAEWIDATTRWSENHPLAMWPGICRVHHASLLHLKGDWEAAEREARQACAELDGFHVPNVAAGYIEIGEIRRRLGDLDAAEAAFATAEALSGQTSPGLALVRLAQRRIDEAIAIITRMLAERPTERLARAKLLPARVQIAIAAGDLDGAVAAADELDEIASAFAGPMLAADARSARGRLQLALGDAPGACGTLRDALTLWQELEVPYEEATVRLLLGQACRGCGDEEGAARSLSISAAIFDRLGAAHDAAPADARSPSSLPAGLTEREAEVLALVASGLTNKELATRLYLSERTVARHLSNIFTKVGVTSRTAAAAFAFEHGLAHSDPTRRDR
ncbi:MAG: LuxR C-terminal-related transcriptional regulator [Microthrixaceae bacterium]